MFDFVVHADRRDQLQPEPLEVWRAERVTGGLLPAPWEFRPGGESGLVISDLLPRLRDCADDLCVVKSMVGGNPNHAPAANHLFSGRIDQQLAELAGIVRGFRDFIHSLDGFGFADQLIQPPSDRLFRLLQDFVLRLLVVLRHMSRQDVVVDLAVILVRLDPQEHESQCEGPL